MSVKIKNKEKEDELHIKGEFIAGWKPLELNERQSAIVTNMLNRAYEEGQRTVQHERLQEMKTQFETLILLGKEPTLKMIIELQQLYTKAYGE